MPRPKRQDFDGAYHHVMARGHRGEKVFLQDEDRQDFLSYLGKVCERYEWRIYAYVLMDNHYHLLVHTPGGQLSKGMGELNGYYTRRLNWRHDRNGHVFQDRFKSLLIVDDSYLLEVVRYISMNPVAAGLAKDPKDWAWSSYPWQTGDGRRKDFPSWLEIDKVLGFMATGKTQARSALRRFVTARDDAAKASGERFAELLEPDPKKARELRHKGIISDLRSGMSRADVSAKWGVGQTTVQRLASRR